MKNKNKNMFSIQKSYSIGGSNSQDKCLKLDESVHLKCCLYVTKMW